MSFPFIPPQISKQARVYLLSAGFSLTFGSMFAKTYRVHRIFTHSWGGVFCKDKMLKDTKLISMVCCLLLLDALIVSTWTLMDPMQRNLRNLTIEISLTDRSVVYQPQVCLIQFYKAILKVKSYFFHTATSNPVKPYSNKTSKTF